jgi:hypothetical protein
MSLSSEAGAMTDRYEVTLSVDAPRDRVFEVLADPRRHVAIDASGMVQGTESPAISAPGQTFVMDMYRDDLGHYRTLNTVTEFETGARFGWAPQLDTSFACPLVDRLASVRTGGHTYTYVVEDEGDGSRVTQIYDWSGVADPQFAAFCPLITRDQLAATLANLAEVVSPSHA